MWLPHLKGVTAIGKKMETVLKSGKVSTKASTEHYADASLNLRVYVSLRRESRFEIQKLMWEIFREEQIQI